MVLCGMYGCRVEIRLVLGENTVLARLLRWLRTVVKSLVILRCYISCIRAIQNERDAPQTSPDRNQNKHEIESLQTRGDVTKICTHVSYFQI